MNQNLLNQVYQVMPAVKATGLMRHLCTIQQPDGVFDAAGAPSGVFVDVLGLILIQCMDAVPSTSNIMATEAKELPQIASKGLRHVALDNYYPTVISGWPDGWRAVVSDDIDGVPLNPIVYDIMGVEPDSQRSQTRLMLQLVTV